VKSTHCLLFVVAIASLSCGRKPNPKAQQDAVAALPDTANPLPESSVTEPPQTIALKGLTTSAEPFPSHRLRQGFYYGPWDDGYQTRWLLLLITPSLQGITYYNGDASPLCSLQMRGDSVAFLTDDLTYWQTDQHFTFGFVGTLGSGGLSGVLVMNGGPYNGRAFPTQFSVLPTDTLSTAIDSSREGVYASVRYIAEAGDLLGDGVLVVNTNQGVAAFYTDFSGVPAGPFPADSVALQGDTLELTTRLYRRTAAPSRFTFTLLPDNLAPVPDSSVTENSSSPRPLARKTSLAGLIQDARAGNCSHPESPKPGE